MNKLVNEWIQKAEGDYTSALREYRARKFPNYDAAGFHSQQCIEKYLKAILQANKVPFISELELHQDLLAYLNQFAVAYRYPGELASREQAKQAIKALKVLRAVLRNALGL